MPAVVEKQNHRDMQRRAAISVSGRRLAQVRRHFLDEADGRGAAQNAGRGAAAELRVLGRRDVHGCPELRSAAWATSMAKRNGKTTRGSRRSARAISRSRPSSHRYSRLVSITAGLHLAAAINTKKWDTDVAAELATN